MKYIPCLLPCTKLRCKTWRHISNIDLIESHNTWRKCRSTLTRKFQGKAEEKPYHALNRVVSLYSCMLAEYVGFYNFLVCDYLEFYITSVLLLSQPVTICHHFTFTVHLPLYCQSVQDRAPQSGGRRSAPPLRPRPRRPP